MQNRRRRGIVRQIRRRPLHILRRIQLAHKRNRPPRHQRELHLVPILARGVVDNRPSLEHRLPAGRQNQPVARFPHRRWNHVTRLHLALPRVGGIDIHAALLLRPRRRQRREIILELPLQFRVGEADSGRRAQIHGAQFAAIQQQRELLALRLLIARGFDAPSNNHARHRLAAELQFHARALQLIEHAAQRLPVADLERKLGQLMAQRVHRIVAQPGDLSAAALLHGERFQHVVHLARVEIEPRRFARLRAAPRVRRIPRRACKESRFAPAVRPPARNPP